MSEADRLDAVGIGSMVVDRLYRVPRVLGPDEKGILHRGAGGAVAERYVGGVVLNHLGWAAALGLRTGIFGKQADDEPGRFLRAAMDRHGIVRHLVLDGSSSSTAELFVDDAGGRAIYMAPGATAETSAEDVRRDHADFIRRAKRVTTEVSQLPLAAVLEVLRIAEQAGIPTLLDLDVPPSEAIPGLGDRDTLEAVVGSATILKPAKRAALELVPDAGDDALAMARALADRYGNAAVVVTDGAAGCAIAVAGTEIRVPAPKPKQVLDSTGAGDAFLGGLLVALECGLDWPDAGKLANACGAACVEKLGAFPDDADAARSRVLELYDGPPLALASRPTATSAAPGQPALDTLDVITTELASLGRRADGARFQAAVALIRSAEAAGGRVHVTGIGKPEHVAHYAASLLSSTGTPASFLHGTEAVHGSAGQIRPGDVVIAVSNSGETPELRGTVEALRGLGARVIGVTGAPGSWLAGHSEVVLEAGVAREGGGLGLAPRASVVAEVAVLAALSAALEEARSFTRAEYHARHPGGKLGEKSRE